MGTGNTQLVPGTNGQSSIPMRRQLFLLTGLGCGAGLLFDTPQQRLFAAFIGAILPIAAFFLGKVVRIAARKARHRNWRQFSLRGLLIMIVICAIGLTVYDRWLRSYHEAWQLIAAVNGLGGSATFSSRGIGISLVGVSDDVLASLAAMPGSLKVSKVNLRGSITDAGVVHLSHFPELSVIALSQCPVTDEGVKQLQRIPKLRGLHLDGCSNVSYAGVAWLAERREMRAVNVMNTRVAPAEMEELAKALPYCDVARNRP